MTSLETRIPPPVILLFMATVMHFADRHTPQIPVPTGVRLPLTGLLIACGVLINVAGVLAFRRRRTTLNPLHPDKASELVTDGIFRYTRNPMYLGMLLMLCGWALYLASPVSLLGPVGFAVYMTRFQIIPEERIIRDKFGARSDEYFRTAPRWF